MCDFSLEYTSSREANVADKLVTTVFPGTITRGFRDAGDRNVKAVCLKCGTEIAFTHKVRFYEPVTMFVKTMAFNVARFTQVNMDKPREHHDALEFPDGTVILLHQLCEGQHAHVLQLPAEPRPLTPEQESLVLAAVGEALAPVS